MSETTRELLADAASNVEGIDVSAYYRQVTRTGSGFIRRETTTYPNPFGGVVTWQVVVVGPKDPADFERWYDRVSLELVQQLAGHLSVTRSEPSAIVHGDGPAIPVALIQGSREEA